MEFQFKGKLRFEDTIESRKMLDQKVACWTLGLAIVIALWIYHYRFDLTLHYLILLTPVAYFSGMILSYFHTMIVNGRYRRRKFEYEHNISDETITVNDTGVTIHKPYYDSMIEWDGIERYIHIEAMRIIVLVDIREEDRVWIADYLLDDTSRWDEFIRWMQTLPDKWMKI